MRVTELATLVSSFQQNHPNVTIEVRDGTQDKLREWLEQGEVDVALTILGVGVGEALPEAINSRNENREQSQNSSVLFQQPLLLAVPQQHVFAQRASVQLAELHEQPFIERIYCEFAQRECEILGTANIHPRVVYRASHEEWVISWITAGLGISIMPYWRGLTAITYIPVSDLDFRRTIGIKWRQQQNLEVVEQFCHYAASHNWEVD